MTTVRLGNTAPLLADGSIAEIGNTTTFVDMREGWDDADVAELALSTANDPTLSLIARTLSDEDKHYAIGLLEISSLWTGIHSGDSPEWVESDDERFAELVAEYFSAAVGRPEGWKSFADLPPIGGGAYGTSFAPEEFGHDFLTRWREHNLLTNGGRDALHAQHLGTSAQPAAFNYMALTANSAAESAANTTLPSEIVTGGGGLIRAQATYAHTAGTNTSTLTKTFTANGSDSLPVTIAKIGVFNAASSGTLGYEKLLSATATLNVSGDNVAVTHTITGG